MTFTEQYPVKLVEQEVHVDLLQLYHAVPGIALNIYLEYTKLAIINKNDTRVTFNIVAASLAAK